jgi:hypothetical protein
VHRLIVNIGRHGGDLAFWVSVRFLFIRNKVLKLGLIIYVTREL